MFVDPIPYRSGQRCQECERCKQMDREKDDIEKLRLVEQIRGAQGAQVIGGAINGLIPQVKPADHTWILIEGLKRLSGGQQVIDAYNAAAGKVSPSPALDAYNRSVFSQQGNVSKG